MYKNEKSKTKQVRIKSQDAEHVCKMTKLLNPALENILSDGVHPHFRFSYPRLFF